MPSLGAWSSTTSSLVPSLDHASELGPVPPGVSSSKIATGGGVVPALATWIAYWQTGFERTVNLLHEGSWFSTQASSAGLAGSGAGSAFWGSVSVAVSDHTVPIVPGLGALSGRV